MFRRDPSIAPQLRHYLERFPAPKSAAWGEAFYALLPEWFGLLCGEKSITRVEGSRLLDLAGPFAELYE